MCHGVTDKGVTVRPCRLRPLPTSLILVTTLSEGLVHSTVYNHLRQLSVDLQSGALIFVSELPGVILLFTNKNFK